MRIHLLGVWARCEFAQRCLAACNRGGERNQNVFKSRRTFQKELESVGKIPGVLFESEADYDAVADPPFRSIQTKNIYSAPVEPLDLNESDNQVFRNIDGT